MFELKKLIASLLMPLPSLIILGFIGLFIVMFSKRRFLGSMAIFLSLCGLLLCSYYPISSSLLMPIERQYKQFSSTNKNIDFVMVLGHSHVVDSDISPVSELSRNSLMRLAEGIRIYRMYPGSKLIVSGYDGGTDISHARMMAKVAIALGVSKADILLLEDAKDTWEEAKQAAAFVGQRNLVLVTSASHMERALSEFNFIGLNPVPAPTNYLVAKGIQQPWHKYMPKAEYLYQTEIYWHETLGLWWRHIRDTVTGD